jgi:N-methylhydantoinase A
MSLQQCEIAPTKFYYEGDWHDANIYDRNKLNAGVQVPGPAIVSEMDSTTVVLSGYVAEVDAVGNLLINPANGGQ